MWLFSDLWSSETAEGQGRNSLCCKGKEIEGTNMVGVSYPVCIYT